MERIKYIGFYDIEKHKIENRNYVLSAKNKMDSIIDSLLSIGIDVDIISMCSTQTNSNYRGHKEIVKNRVTLKTFYTFGQRNLVSKIMNRVCMRLQFISYLLAHTRKEEWIIVYHSPTYIFWIKLLCLLKKINLVLEVEEIYGDIFNDKRLKAKELKLTDIARAFIFPSELLNSYINKNNKKFCIMYGAYDKVSVNRKLFYDGRIHCVFAGTFFKQKGVEASINAAKFLSNEYYIHIIGFGEKDDIDYVKNKVSEVAKISDCGLSYDGCLIGEEYERFIASCDIGLSTQNSKTSFNDTSFPSKITSYMSNGLRVVSVRMKSIERSKLNKYIFFYDGDKPEKIADTIKKIKLEDDYSGQKIINNLKEEFEKDLIELLNQGSKTV